MKSRRTRRHGSYSRSGIRNIIQGKQLSEKNPGMQHNQGPSSIVLNNHNTIHCEKEPPEI